MLPSDRLHILQPPEQPSKELLPDLDLVYMISLLL